MLHRKVVKVFLLPNCIDRDDVGMIQPSHRLSFFFEAADDLRLGIELLRKYLDRYKAAQRGVLASVDDPHPPTPQL